MIIYLAGPMSGLPDYNRPAFARAETYARARGWTVVSPQRTDPAHDGACPAGELHVTDAGAHPYGCWARASLRMMLDCDAVLLLPGWQASRGARLERQVAETCSMPIHDMPADLEAL